MSDEGAGLADWLARKNRRRPNACPKCKSASILPIAYGMPGTDLQRALERGEVAPGGCVVTGNDPKWECQACQHRWPNWRHDRDQYAPPVQPYRNAEEWRRLIVRMLPQPVAKVDAVTLIGGEPRDVVVTVNDEFIYIAKHGVMMPGDQEQRPDHQCLARLNAKRTNPRAVARAIMRACGGRLATHEWCTRCEEITPPEWMFEDGMCQRCAEKHFGIAL